MSIWNWDCGTEVVVVVVEVVGREGVPPLQPAKAIVATSAAAVMTSLMSVLRRGRARIASRETLESRGKRMPKAVFDGTTIAESSDTEIVEGNHYFPRESVQKQFLQESDATTVCPWKGTAHYYDVVVGDARASGAAWYYPEPKPAAARIRDRVAFWRGVEVVD